MPPPLRVRHCKHVLRCRMSLKLGRFLTCKLPQVYSSGCVNGIRSLSNKSAASLWRKPCGFGNNYKLARSLAHYSTTPETDEYRSALKHTENAVGTPEKREFQAETRMLLDIVAKSLYSEKEVFIRELISNSSDALEKLRYLTLVGETVRNPDRPLEIHIATDKDKRTFTIQDTGVGMTKEELIDHLGVIARSGSKKFLNDLKENKGSTAEGSNIIGQFGVGFYSAFMVADKVEVYTQSSKPDSKGVYWSSDGLGSYEVQDAEGVQEGTKIILHLKQESAEFSDEQAIKDVIKRYSNFVGSSIYLNGVKINSVKPLWLLEPRDVSSQEHEEFYRFISGAFDQPRFVLHYKIDAPLNVRALLYVPEGKPGLFELNRDAEVGVSLYCKKVLIKHRAENILPKWLRFVKGVVDSEDIPLNLSRELLQDSSLIRKLRTVLTNRFLRFLFDKSLKAREQYEAFYKDYGLFLKEGIVTGQEQSEKEELAKLLLYESSMKPAGEKTTISEYCSRLKPGQRDIYYLAAPSRALAETSPYYEAVKEQNIEVLFCFEPYDELVFLQLGRFDSKNLTSVEKEMRRDKEVDVTEGAELDKSACEDLKGWIKSSLGPKVAQVTLTGRLQSHPCMITVEEMGAARHFVKTQFQGIPEEQRYQLLQPRLEINPSHPIIIKLNNLRSSHPELAELVAQQLFANAMVAAGLIDDPRTVVTGMNQLLTLALEKY